MTALSDDAIDRLRHVADMPDLTDTRYRLVRKLDRGGMGTVYLVEDVELGREVALKVLSAPDPSGDLAERLLSEARHLARLEHPNIVPIHDVGVLPDGRVYYAMKLVRGRRLDAWRTDAPGRPAKLRLFQKICEAVAFAHAQGVIHRDLKPENIMVGAFGEALVMDWGVARLVAEPSPANEQGALIGTPAYMAPEQAGGATPLDIRCDVYALGAILYFLLSGAPPFEGDSALEVLEKVRIGAPAPLRRLDRSIPSALEAICAKAMSADREQRYESARHMSDDVERFLDGLPVLAHPENLLEKTARFVDRNKGLIWLVVAYLLMRMIVMGFTRR